MNAPASALGNGLIKGAPVPQIDNLARAAKELGMGMPPPSDPTAADNLAMQICCGETNRMDVVESSEWQFSLPMLDSTIANNFGPNINVFGTTNGLPPPGIAAAYNTLTTPNMPNSNMVLWGLIVRFSVEAEGRLIRGNYYLPAGGAPGTPPPSLDVYSSQDLAALTAAGAIAAGSTIVPGELVYGFPTWRSAYDMSLGYGLNWFKEHQISLIRQPLKTLAIISQFAQAEAAGFAYASNLDRIAAYNALTAGLGYAPGAGVFLPLSHKRLGTWLGYAAGATQGPDVTPSREEDASPTMFGSLGAPQNPFAPAPLIFSSPMFWPRGAPLGINFEVINQNYQADMQRWMSISGGVSGIPGADLNLGLSASVNGITTAGAVEQSLDAIPAAVASLVNTNRMIGKFGNMNILVGLLGKRIPQHWLPCVGRLIKNGAIQSPMGYGDATHYVEAA